MHDACPDWVGVNATRNDPDQVGTGGPRNVVLEPQARATRPAPKLLANLPTLWYITPCGIHRISRLYAALAPTGR